MRDIYQISANEQKLRQLDRRDKVMKTFEGLVLILVVGLTGLSNFRLNQVATVVQRNVVEHRQQVEDVDKLNQKQITDSTNSVKAENHTILCIISVRPPRPAEYVKSCYDSVQKSSGINVERFGDGIE